MMNEGDARKAARIACATWAGVPAGVRLLSRMKLVTSVVVSGRRNTLRPNVWTVVVRQLVVFVVGSQLMNLALAVVFPMTWAAMACAAVRYPFHPMASRLPAESGDNIDDGGRLLFDVSAVTPSRSLITLSYCASVMRGICVVGAIPFTQAMMFD